jgi:hypothetical protein
VATIFPPVDVFEDVADAKDFEALMALRARTDPFLSARIQPAMAIAPNDRVYGPGAGYVMGPFAFPSPGNHSASITRRGTKPRRSLK